MAMEPRAGDVFEAICQSPWFAGLPGPALQQLLDASRVKHYPTKSYLYSCGEKTSEVFCVLGGRVRVSISSSEGHEFAITELEAGSWLGEPALVNDAIRVLDAQARCDSVVLVIPETEVLTVGEQYPLIYRNLFHEHVVRSRGVYNLLGGVLFYKLRARLAGRVLDLVRDHGELRDGGVYLHISLSQNDFARLSFGSRQRINRIFRDWAEAGIVRMREDKYFIQDLGALRRELELSA